MCIDFAPPYAGAILYLQRCLCATLTRDDGQLFHRCLPYFFTLATPQGMTHGKVSAIGMQRGRLLAGRRLSRPHEL